MINKLSYKKKLYTFDLLFNNRLLADLSYQLSWSLHIKPNVIYIIRITGAVTTDVNRDNYS